MALIRRARLSALAPLFLISLATVGFEISLTRYFAVAKWSEYGYWVISIVLAGFALSGVVMALCRDTVARRSEMFLTILPVVLIAAAAIGFHFVTTNPFNPLQLQNPATFAPQLWDIGGYYLALLPFFFLSGLYISLCFVANDADLGRVYGFDLTGAGIGALTALCLMWMVAPFHLVPCLLIALAAAAVFAPRHRVIALIAALVVLGAGEALLLGDDEAAFNDFKAIYAPLHVPDSRTVAVTKSPRGLYMLLDDFTERADTDVSNNAGMLGLPGPPSSLGLYRDGNRIAAIPKVEPIDASYAGAALSALPYTLSPHPSVLLAGSSGGFRIAEALKLGARAIDATEPEPILNQALHDGIGSAQAFPTTPALRILAASPIAIATEAADGKQLYDLVDISSDFLDSGEANTSAFAAQALATYLTALSPNGMVSIPVSIREFPAYAVRVLATVRAALLQSGVADPLTHVLVYRSAWNVRILVSPAPFDAARIAAAKQFCDARSFDLSYYPGIDVFAARANIYNDLPAVSFEAGEVASGDGAHDAIADEAGAALAGEHTASSVAFNLAPITYDRPFYYAVLRLDQIGTILKRIEILPQAEVGPLVNLAVLAQAIVIALIVLAVPLFGRVRSEATGTFRAIVYFAALGLGFLFIEIFLIERTSFYLNDRVSAFALVLTGMLIFSGLGSMMSGRFAADPRRGLYLAIVIIVTWCAIVFVALQPLMLATLGWPWAARAAVMTAIVAPVSVALGLPFPLGLARAGPTGFLPWAWGLNGAFSVVATPLANLIALEDGFDRVLLVAMVLYVTVAIAFPTLRKKVQWQDISAV
jgi:hypothetical protein